MKKSNLLKMFVLMIIAATYVTACIPTTGGIAIAPTVSSTTTVSSITSSTAISGGTISSNGGATVTASGIVWGTSSNPIIALSTKTTTNPVITTGAFIGNISGLTSGTTYYVRAYATNSAGTGYGAQVSFVASGSTSSGDIPAVFTGNFTSAVTLSTEGNYIVLQSKGIPDHVSPYWPASNALYMAPASGHIKNPSYIGEQNFTMKILKSPQAATTQEATNMGPIGMALNGVAIYNNLEAGSIPIEAVTVTTFDNGGGHSGPGDLYHYHCEPTYISNNDSKIIGFLMDGYPIYGRKDTDGSYPSDLDANGGHFGITADYPSGIYHYHCSNVNYMGTGYYILKSGNYYGVKGTFTY